MSDYPMLISNKLHSFRNFDGTKKQGICFANISLVLYLNVSVLTFGGYNISLPPSNSYQLR